MVRWLQGRSLGPQRDVRSLPNRPLGRRRRGVEVRRCRVSATHEQHPQLVARNARKGVSELLADGVGLAALADEAAEPQLVLLAQRQREGCQEEQEPRGEDPASPPLDEPAKRSPTARAGRGSAPLHRSRARRGIPLLPGGPFGAASGWRLVA